MAQPGAGRISQVDGYIAKAAPFARPILLHLRDVVHEAAPGVQEAIKWSRPFFLYRGIILGNMAAFKQHCSFGLWGAQIATELRSEGIASGEAMGSFGRIASVEDLPRRETLLNYVRRAAQAIEVGERTNSLSRAKVAKPALPVPEALIAALGKNRAAATRFESMSPSCQREYCEWIAEAKREETRQKRLATALEWIAEGKSRNWKYERL
jgi:uncharacterized protein YdeI (YjbR/CyaY-like superfamily)